uniref:Putative ovule protein n=1 Tax=Solanum chacoense TaxID=4108 RepID=A0A0V0ISX0_SOLCH
MNRRLPSVQITWFIQSNTILSHNICDRFDDSFEPIKLKKKDCTRYKFLYPTTINRVSIGQKKQKYIKQAE